MDWLLSALTFLAKIPVFRRWWWAPVAGILIQAVWILYEVKTKQYGLIPLTIMYAVMWVWSWPKWFDSRNAGKDAPCK